MSRADKRLLRVQEHEYWLRGHGYRCVACGHDLDDDDLVAGADPREPRTCMDCCGAEVPEDLAKAAIEAGWAHWVPR